MTIEQLKRAKEIQDEINKIIINLINVKECAFNGDDDLRLSARLHIHSNNHDRELLKEGLMIPLKEFIEMYTQRLQYRLKELEKEFKAL